MPKFEKGKSGNPGGRPREDSEVKRLALQASPLAMKRLREILESDNPLDTRAVIAAAREILDRAVGKPSQQMEHTGKDGAELPIVINVTTKGTGTQS